MKLEWEENASSEAGKVGRYQNIPGHQLVILRSWDFALLVAGSQRRGTTRELFLSCEKGSKPCLKI